ncbi:signal transduction histidine kinase [Rheinheimera pacifica]|uniref:ATP-binding protein n=1 Tax=Rheinheimera pacifica TaxID=173990 RepID=UPI00268BDBB5|nr:ATP-binding protein [Rheinheimera pacifica]MDR6981902.1 signal transduction histidine kinase [Rheinheimera pacifica]
MPLYLVFEISMLLTSGCAVLLAGWLLWQGQRQPGMPALAGFAAMMALWCAGHIAILHQWPQLGIALVLANPLMPMCFLHFALQFVAAGRPLSSRLKMLQRQIPLLYGLTCLLIALSWLFNGGKIIATTGFSAFFAFQGLGWLNLVYTVLLGIAAHGVLLYGWRHHSGNRRRSIGAMFIAGGWGLLLATSFIFPSLGLTWYPYPMLLLPSYLLLLVYGVVRYQVLAINAFANKALLWFCMLLVVLALMALVSAMLGQFGMQALSAVPALQLWLYSALLLLLSAACYQPVAALARRLIYPGVTLNEALLERWRLQLQQTESWTELAALGSKLLSQQLRMRVAVHLPQTQAVVAQLQIHCQRGAEGWHYELKGWDDVTPGYRLQGEVFAALLLSSCRILEQSLKLAEAERKRLDQQHLVELGALSAAMAHELRNPLNIIAMAAASTADDTRQHIQQQLKRADRLIADLLSYSGQLQLQLTTVPLNALLQSLIQPHNWQGVSCQLDVDEQLLITADVYRLQQVIVNLLDNALAFCRNQSGAIIKLQAQQQGTQLLLYVHNNGPAIASEQHNSLFQPFVSKRAGGSGLGLAIVRRIMQAHGGEVNHRTDLGWPVSFELRFNLNTEDITDE